MTTSNKIVLRHLVDLEADINSGKHAIAAGINHANVEVWRRESGRYIAILDINPGGGCFESHELQHHSLQQFLDQIEWDETVEWEIELRTYLSQSIWYSDTYADPTERADDPFSGDGGYEIDPWDRDSFVWPLNHVESIDVIHASGVQAKVNREEYQRRRG